MRLDAYQQRSVAEDIEYLRETWRDGASDSDLRRGSALLRRFLIDGGNGILVAIWHEMGFKDQPTVIAPSLSPNSLASRSKIVLATAGGATVNGIEMGGYLQFKDPFDDNFNPNGHQQRLLDFVSAPCVVIHGQAVTRRELIKYFAHYLGGVHMSRKVMKNEADVVRSLRRIEDLPIQTNLVGKDLLHFELLAIGQAIGRSEDGTKLASAIRAKIG
jgi:hypothetical protein